MRGSGGGRCCGSRGRLGKMKKLNNNNNKRIKKEGEREDDRLAP
jgi:hypothetical protein